MQVTRYLVTPGSQNFGLDMPTDAEVLSVGVEGTSAYIYALGDETAPTQSRTFTAPETGDEVIEADLSFMGSVVLSVGSVRTVFHVFEINQP